MLRESVMTKRIPQQMSPSLQRYIIPLYTYSHELAFDSLQSQRAKFHSTRNVQKQSVKVIVQPQSALPNTTDAKLMRKKPQEHGKLTSKLETSRKQVAHSPRTSLSSKTFTMKSAAALALEQRRKDGSSIRSRDPAIHAVLTDALYPGDTQVLQLPWGGNLSYARRGRMKEDGPVWVVFHGTPGNRLVNHFAHRFGEGSGIRII